MDETEPHNMCSICLESIGKTDVMVTRCNHMFHTTCMLKHAAASNTCPLCRSELIETEPNQPLHFTTLEDMMSEFANRQTSIDDLLSEFVNPPAEPEPTIEYESVIPPTLPVASRTRSHTQLTPTPTAVTNFDRLDNMRHLLGSSAVGSSAIPAYLGEVINLIHSTPEIQQIFNNLVTALGNIFDINTNNINIGAIADQIGNIYHANESL